MTRYDCDVCCGRGEIRVPLYSRLTVAQASIMAADSIPDMTPTSRHYPCPECSDQVDFARVGVVSAIRSMDSRINDAGYIQHCKEEAALQLMSEIVKAGYVKTETGPHDSWEMRNAFRVTVGVVSSKQVASFEERVARRQDDVANEVAREACRQINNWGSYYGHQTISKEAANNLVHDAIGTVRAKRSEWKDDK